MVYASIRTLLLLCVPISYVLAVAAFHLTDPMIGDEFVFLQWVEAARASTPIVNHPPGFTYYLLVIGVLLSVSATSFRIGTLLLALLTVILLYVLAKLVIDSDVGDEFRPGWRRDSRQFPFFVVTVFVVAPAFTTVSTLIDMEIGFVFLTTLYFVWFLWAFEADTANARAKTVGTGLLVAALLWVKLGVLPSIAVSSILYLLIASRPRDAVYCFGGVLTGIAGFLLTWVTFSVYHDVSVTWIFLNDASMVSRNFNFLPFAYLQSIIWVGYKELLWLSPPLLLLSALSLGIERLSERWTFVRRDFRLLFVLFASLTVLQYALIRKQPYGFPKYVIRSLPLLAVLGSITISRTLPAPIRRPRLWATFGTITLGVAATVHFALPDPFLWVYQTAHLPSTAVVTTNFWNVMMYAAVILPVALLVRGAIYQFDLSNTSRRQIAVSILLIFVLGTNLGITVTQATADYSTHYFYGDEGAESAVEHVRTNVDPAEDVLVAAPFDLRPSLDPEYQTTKVGFMSDHSWKNADVLVVRRYHPDNDYLRTQSEFELVERFGDFYVYHRR
jgi:hypothetical protein